ncbi:MAG: flagellar biosynthesis regulator FlaF [Candidatus Eisenbacteria bacterium]|uniref:Flagellar biosynthesis regulator FlaF n=1 Tax=Eiseniibacteriota bacterium TaxID=2212470 RepID=A0A933W9T9_UNCEI|nr:flagellar biosynthesis regulator FlaF [Candidatus Eisenbacteria bacterium]
MFASARRAYESGTKAAPSGRELEAAALFKAARKLEQCRQEWDTPGRETRLEEALRYNLRLWTFFQGEWLGEDCELPNDLRANLLRLSAFVDRRTFELMSEPTPEGLRALVEIDRQIAAGLAAPADHKEAPARAA